MRATLTAIALLTTLAGTALAEYTVQDAFPFLPTFTEPIELTDPMDGSDRLFVIEKAGTIRVFGNNPTASTVLTFLSLVDSVTNSWESGCLGLAFHPNYENNGYFYVIYTTKPLLRTKLSRFTVSANPNVANPASELSILEVRQFNLYHKGGGLQFGPDGYLYVSLGEDGYIDMSQDLTSLKGKLLRIDVDAPAGGKNYGIPPDNPFAGNQEGKREEIWAFGLRNPWRFSFDTWTGRLWLGDVGLNTWEEVNIIKKGRNYGWPRIEGTFCAYPPVCDTTGLNIVLPLHEYRHESEYGAAITGGYVYRGTRLPSLHGSYIYTDHSSGEVWGLLYDGTNPPTNRLLYVAPLPTHFRIADFCQDKDNELFMSSYIVGRIYQLMQVPSGVGESPSAPQFLIANPNPFAGETRIRFTSPGAASIEVYDVAGRLVRRFEDPSTGEREVVWDGSGLDGRGSASGVYFARLVAGGNTLATQRIVLLK